MSRHCLRLLSVCVSLTALSGCNDTLDLAPESAGSAWKPSKSTGLRLPAGAGGFAAPTSSATDRRIAEAAQRNEHRNERTDGLIGAGRPLGLPDLIDIAEANNPQTRVAWEQARQSAIAIGIAQSVLSPQITASILGGGKRTVSAMPNFLTPRGFMAANAAAIFPQVQLSYLLFDFGQARATIDSDKAASIASNFDFTQVHQKLFQSVIQAYYSHEAAVAECRAAEESLKNTRLLQQSAETRRAHGEATLVDTTMARSNTATSAYNLEQKRSAERTSRYALLVALGLPPDRDLTLASSANTRLPQGIPGSITHLIETSLQHRPDILADLYRMDAAAAQTRAARRAMLPKLEFTANVQGYIADQKVYGYTRSAPASRVAQPNGTIALNLTWPVFQGGLLQNQLRLAESRDRAQRATMDKDILDAEEQVASARDALATTLSLVHASALARDAAQQAFDAARTSYAVGMGTLTDASQAQNQLAQASSNYAVSHAQALMDAAALAFATGDLTSAADANSGDDER